MHFLDKLRNKPEHIRKLILWVIVVVVALIMVIWWFYGSYQKVKRFETEEFIQELNFPKIEIPEIETPEINGQ